jgi:hypothetical protein
MPRGLLFGHIGNALRTFWEHIGNTVGTLWKRYRNSFRTQGIYLNMYSVFYILLNFIITLHHIDTIYYITLYILCIV